MKLKSGRFCKQYSIKIKTVNIIENIHHNSKKTYKVSSTYKRVYALKKDTFLLYIKFNKKEKVAEMPFAQAKKELHE